MKLIISILMVPFTLLFVFAGICWGGTSWFLAQTDWALMEESALHTLRGIVYLGIAWGMAAAIVNMAAGAVITLLALVFGAWIRAILLGIMVFCCAMIWLYFLNLPLPLP